MEHYTFSAFQALPEENRTACQLTLTRPGFPSLHPSFSKPCTRQVLDPIVSTLTVLRSDNGREEASDVQAVTQPHPSEPLPGVVGTWSPRLWSMFAVCSITDQAHDVLSSNWVTTTYGTVLDVHSWLSAVPANLSELQLILLLVSHLLHGIRYSEI